MTEPEQPERPEPEEPEQPDQADGLSSPPVESGTNVRRLVHGSAWSIIGQLAPIIVNLGLTPLIVHRLGVARYGLFALVQTVLVVLTSLDGGLSRSTQRYFSVHRGEDRAHLSLKILGTLSLLILAVGTLFTVLMYMIAPTIAAHLHTSADLRPDAIRLLRVLTPVVVLGVAREVYAALLLAYERFAQQAATSVLTNVSFLVAAAVFVELGYGLKGMLIAVLIQEAMALLATGFQIQRLGVFRAHRPGLMSRRQLREFFSFAARGQVATLADLITLELDILIVGLVLPVRYVGIYALGAGIAAQLRGLTGNVASPMISQMGAIYGRSGLPAVSRAIPGIQRNWVIGVSGWCFVGSVSSYFGIIMWLGTDFRLSGLVAALLLVGYAFGLMTGGLALYGYTIGKPGVDARFQFANAVLNLATTVPFAYAFGVLGVALSTTVAQLIASIYLDVLVRRTLPSPPPSFLLEIQPVRLALACAATFALELPVLESDAGGIAGLLLAGVPAVIGLAFYMFLVLGWTSATGWTKRGWKAGRALLS